MASHMLMMLTIYWVDKDTTQRGQDGVTYDANKGVPAAETALKDWEKYHPSQRVYGVAGLPSTLLPELPPIILPSWARHEKPSRNPHIRPTNGRAA